MGGSQPLTPRRLTPPSVDNPPIGGTRLRAVVWPSILLAWQIALAPPPPITGAQIAPIASAVAPDNPPFGRRADNLYTIQRAWPQRDYGRPAGSSGDAPAPAADSPPGLRRVALADILRAWEPPTAATQRRVSLVQGAPADDPPFGAPRALTRSIVLEAWSPGPPAPQWGRHVPASTPSVDDPPRTGRPSLAQVLASWQPVAPQPWIPRHVPPESVPSDDPPFGAKRLGVSQWYVVESAPFSPRPMVQGAAPVEDPPFTGGRVNSLNTVLVAWHLAPPLPTLRRFTVPVAPQVADDPPFGRRSALPAILQAWRSRPIGSSSGSAAAAVDDPPFGARPTLGPIVEAWHRLPLRPTLPVHVVQPGVAAAGDDPPFGKRAWLPSTVEAWSKRGFGVLWSGALAQPYVPDDPPFGVPPRWLPSVLASWQPLPQPRQRETVLVQPGVAAAADAPPFGLRTPLWPILRAWEPGPPAPWQARYLVQGSTVPADDPPFGRTAASAPWLWQAASVAVSRRQHIAPLVPVADNPPFGLRVPTTPPPPPPPVVLLGRAADRRADHPP